MLKLADMDFRADFITLLIEIRENMLALMKTSRISAEKNIETIKKNQKEIPELKKKCNFENKTSLNRLNSILDMTEEPVNLKIDQ